MDKVFLIMLAILYGSELVFVIYTAIRTRMGTKPWVIPDHEQQVNPLVSWENGIVRHGTKWTTFYLG